MWVPVYSSNVDSIAYDAERRILRVRYHGGRAHQAISEYEYGNVDLREAKAMFHDVSHGKWVWDNLRVRGTIDGFQKPYRRIR